MAARDYTVIFENVSVSAAQDLFELTPADDKPIRIMAVTLDNVGGTADSADADSEQLRLSIVRGHTTSGSGGTAPTPQPLGGESAAGFTAKVNNTTIASAGTGATLTAFGFNVRVGSREFWPEECWPGASQANTLIVVRLLAAPADAVAMSGTLYVRELY